MEEKCWLYDRCNHKDCEKDFCLRKYKLDYLYNESNLSADQRVKIKLSADADHTDEEEFAKLAYIEEHIEGFVAGHKKLYLHSSICGNGKTSWAIRLINAYLNKVWAGCALECKAIFINVPRFLNSLKLNMSGFDAYAPHVREALPTADLVVWDDIAAKNGSEYDIDQLLTLIESCNNKSVVYTTNLNRSELARAVDSRITSRICGSDYEIELHGADKRVLKSYNNQGGH